MKVNDETTIWSVLKQRNKEMPSKTACIFYNEKCESSKITYSELFLRSQSFAFYLHKKGINTNDRCILLFEQGTEFIIAFCACSYLGAIPVPLDLPKKNGEISKWERIVEDTEASCIISRENESILLRELFSNSDIFRNIPIYNEESYKEKSDYVNEVSSRLALLQYTSGSTGEPKGVMISNESIIENLKQIVERIHVTEESIICSWLPHYHDMGLIGGILISMYKGATLILMSPKTFVTSPLIWAKLIAKYKGTHIAGPNFGYTVLKEALEYEYLKDKNSNKKYCLKTLKCVLCGAEPVNLKNIFEFEKIACSFGMKEEAMIFGYGLAEMSLIASSYDVLNHEKIKWIGLLRNELKHNRVKVIETGYVSDFNKSTNLSDKDVSYYIGSGYPIKNHKILIYDDSGEIITDSYKIGEIVCGGTSVADGYWNKAEDSKEKYFIDQEGIRYVRTGDIGFFNEFGEIFITGRKKEMIIINGENYYPSDIEKAAFSASDKFIENGTAAFLIQNDNCEGIGIAQELDRITMEHSECKVLAEQIRKEVMRVHGLKVDKIIFLKKMGIPRTISGKIQRVAVSKMNYYESWNGVLGISELLQCEDKENCDIRTESECFLEVNNILTKITGIKFDGGKENIPFTELGMTSLMCMDVAKVLENKFKIMIKPEVFYTQGTAKLLSQYIWNLLPKKVSTEHATKSDEIDDEALIQSLKMELKECD